MTINLGTLKLGARLRGDLVISLEQGEFLRLEEPEGVEVRCESGKLWITHENDVRDHWIGRGEAASLSARGSTLIEAMSLTTLRIGRPAA